MCKTLLRAVLWNPGFLQIPTCRGVDELEDIGVLLYEAMYHVRLVQTDTDGIVILARTWHITGPELQRTQAQFHLRVPVFNSSSYGQNVRRFADDIFKCIFMNEKSRILFLISLNFIPTGPIDNNPALVWIMTWHRRGDKPLSEPMLTRFTDAYMRH